MLKFEMVVGNGGQGTGCQHGEIYCCTPLCGGELPQSIIWPDQGMPLDDQGNRRPVQVYNTWMCSSIPEPNKEGEHMAAPAAWHASQELTALAVRGRSGEKLVDCGSHFPPVYWKDSPIFFSTSLSFERTKPCGRVCLFLPHLHRLLCLSIPVAAWAPLGALDGISCSLCSRRLLRLTDSRGCLCWAGKALSLETEGLGLGSAGCGGTLPLLIPQNSQIDVWMTQREKFDSLLCPPVSPAPRRKGVE